MGTSSSFIFVVGQLTPSESLFYYAPGEGTSTFSKPNHEPVFPDETVGRYTPEQLEVCGDDQNCLFDSFETNDIEVGRETRTTNIDLKETAATVRK